MFKNFRDKIAFSGLTVLTIGVALLIFTFISAYVFLTKSLSIIASEDLLLTFGEALAPLVATCIRIMYLGVMGWVGSLLTIRGVTIITHAPKMPEQLQQKPTGKPVSKKVRTEQPREEPKPEAKRKPPEPKPLGPKPPEPKPEAKPKPSEPEVIVRPPAPTQHQHQSQEQKQEDVYPQQQSNS